MCFGGVGWRVDDGSVVGARVGVVESGGVDAGSWWGSDDGGVIV